MDTLRKSDQAALAALKEEMAVRKTDEVFVLFPMGSQFDHLIAQKLARIGVFCVVADPASVTADDIRALSPTGIILSGGPASVCTEPPKFDPEIFDLGVPVLGICLGFQMWAKHVGLAVVPSDVKEFDVRPLCVLSAEGILAGFGETSLVQQSHGDRIVFDTKMKLLGSTDLSNPHDPAVSAGSFAHLHGVQFHPEVTHTEKGLAVFENFCFGVCGARDRFPAENIAEKKVAALREQIGDEKVLMALSGGSDSSVVAYLVGQVLGETVGRVRGVYIRGIDRPDDEAFARRFFGSLPWLELVVIDASDRFLASVAGVTGMAQKRTAMRGVYHDVLEGQIADFGAGFITQGTLYTDKSESGDGIAAGGARKAKIKQHHNTNMEFSVPKIEPLDDLVKDNARGVGRSVGVPEELLVRHPFPGPGLLVRVDGEVTAEKLAMARKLDDIYIEELRRADLYASVWQAGVNILSSQHTFTKGDDAGSGVIVMAWAVWSVDGFTATAARLPWDFLDTIQRRFGNEVPGIGAVSVRISNKPFSTIEQG
jgi:GMP synthase (glutamine-hydrolysing)